MNIQLARTFLEVVSAGSMSIAAERLNVTHSTVTVRIRTLEEILRRTLLVRSRNGVTLTADGVRFLEYAESLVRTWQMARRRMSLASGFEGNLAIGVDSTLWHGLMPEWILETRNQHPEIALSCERGASSDLIQRLFEGWLDVCFVYETQTRSGFKIEKLFSDPLIVVSTEQRDAKPWDPQFISIDYGSAVKYQEEMLWGEVDETPHMSVNELPMALQFLSAFGGSILIPKRIYEAGSLPCPLYPVAKQPQVERTAYMIYSPQNLQSRTPNISPRDIKASLIRLAQGVDIIGKRGEITRSNA